MEPKFKQALTLLRDLADMQNGEEQNNCTCCPECGCKEYVNENLVGDGYRMCRECHQDWWTDIKYSSKFCKPLIDRVYDFLNEHEKRIKPDSIEEYYMTVGKIDEMKAKVRAFENSFGSSIFPSGEAIARLLKEPLPLKKRELNRSI